MTILGLMCHQKEIKHSFESVKILRIGGASGQCVPFMNGLALSLVHQTLVVFKKNELASHRYSGDMLRRLFSKKRAHVVMLHIVSKNMKHLKSC